MQKHLQLFLFFLLLSALSCKKDDCPRCEICEDCEVCEECTEYVDHEVDFFTAHRDFLLIPPVFEMVTEQVLKKPAHLEGATFEEVTEQVLSKSSYSVFQIWESHKMHLVVNAERDSIAEITCYNFFDEDNIIEEERPAEYRTRTAFVLVQEGTGPEVPAEYETLIKEVLNTPSHIVEIEEEQPFNRFTFRIPNHLTIRQYLDDQFAQQSIDHCQEGNGYRIGN